MVFISLGLAAIAFYAGFLTKPHAGQHRSRVAFVFFVLLAGFTGYFAWKGMGAREELSAIIALPPEARAVDRIPTGAELAAVARMVETVPARGPLSDASGREGLTERMEAIDTRYWSVTTPMSMDDIAAHYRERADLNGWTLNLDEPPYLGFVRGGGAETLMLFVQNGWDASKVWYIYRDAQ